MSRPEAAKGDSLPHLLDDETYLGLKPVRDRGRAVLLFPNTYRLGMSSLALQTLYALFNNAGLVCERAFLPDGKAQRALAAGLRSLESETPLGGFEFVLLSSSFELDWLLVPALLEAGGIPARREDRDETHPIVFAGGAAVTGNPEPLAGIADVLVRGEIEPIAADLLATLTGAESREEVFDGLASLPGVYLPSQASSAQTVARLVQQRLDEVPTETTVLTPHTEFPSRFLIEVSRGCGRTCRFCMGRQLYHPLRVRHLDALVPRIERALEYTDRVGLVGAAISDYPWVDELVSLLRERGTSLSVSSVRAENVSEALVTALAQSGQDTLTLAPETGSDALRAAIGKTLTREHLHRCLRLGLAAGISHFRLYFMLGLPGEEPEDVEAIPRLVAHLREQNPGAVLSASINPFAPKPHTPFAQAQVLPEAEVTRRLRQVTNALRKAGVHDVTTDSPRAAEAQAVLGRGGRELSEPLIAASLQGASLGAFRREVNRSDRTWNDYLTQGEGQN